MSEEQRAVLAELLAFLEAETRRHRAAGRLGAGDECERYAEAVKGLLDQ